MSVFFSCVLSICVYLCICLFRVGEWRKCESQKKEKEMTIEFAIIIIIIITIDGNNNIE